MKENKKKWYIIIGVIVAIVAAVVIYVCATYLPRLQVGKEISDLLQPLLTEENQSMHMDVTTDLAGESMNLYSDIYLVKDEEIKYVVMEQYDFPIYIADNVLYLENGHAFKMTKEMQMQSVNYDDLFLQLAAAYEVFDITCVKTDLETGYAVNVTGEQVQELLRMVVPVSQESEDGENEILSYIENLNVQLIAKGDKLDRIEMSGKADVNGTVVQVEVSLSDFRVLEAGDYVIPDLIKEAVQAVDKDTLFNLTEDLYRCIVAFQKLSNQENDGTVTLSANCGIINFNHIYDLKDLATKEIDSMDTEAVENLPAMIGFLCMEGEISCTEVNTGYEYKLVLDKESMQKIAETVVPELVNYVVTMTDGMVVVMLENDSITSIEISIEGSINVLFTEVPAKVGAVFKYE